MFRKYHAILHTRYRMCLCYDKYSLYKYSFFKYSIYLKNNHFDLPKKLHCLSHILVQVSRHLTMDFACKSILRKCSSSFIGTKKKQVRNGLSKINTTR